MAAAPARPDDPHVTKAKKKKEQDTVFLSGHGNSLGVHARRAKPEAWRLVVAWSTKGLRRLAGSYFLDRQAKFLC